MNIDKEDHIIVQMYFDRNEDAIEITKLKYGNLCLKLSQNIVNDPWDVEECLNDLYDAIWNTIPPHRPDSLKAYACKLIRRISINKAVYNKAQKRDVRKTVGLEDADADFYEAFGDSCDVNDGFLTDKINSYLSRISRERRAILVLRFWYGMTFDQISHKTGVNVNTVKTILRRELKYMRKYLEKEGIYNA